MSFSRIINTFVDSTTYNALPHIKDARDALSQHAADLDDLRKLIDQHRVSNAVSVRLIHKHFDCKDGEVMALGNVKLVDDKPPAIVMKPVIPDGDRQLHGIHYLVNQDGRLQAYEYGARDITDIFNTTGMNTFLGEFCRMVTERGLQQTFGLKFGSKYDSANTGWTEYEIHSKRGTVMFPDEIGVPENKDDKLYSVTTEWKGLGTRDDDEGSKTCKHSKSCKHGNTTCKHCSHCHRHDHTDRDCQEEEGYCLGGTKILPDTPFHQVMTAVIAAF